MAGAPAGFSDLINRKYDILQQTADSEAGLRGAQAAGITGALPSENALRGAQAFSTTQQGKTLAPLADASIASTYAGIPTQTAQAGLIGAQTGLVGAQAGEVGFNTTRPANDFELGSDYDQRLASRNFGLGFGGSLTPTDPNRKIKPVGQQFFSAGTANVQPKGKGTPEPQPMAAPMGMTMQDVIAHAMGAVHAAGGATTVLPTPPLPAGPAPGQTITNGTWGSPTPNQDLRKQMGMGVKAAGGATDVKPVPAPGQTTTGGSWNPADLGGNTPNPNGQNQSLRRGLGMGVKAAGGATAIPYKGGTAKVPGKGAPNVDSVPATLAPQEAVLNQGAADHLGRGTIAALNALGAAKMAAHGMPPATPPTAHGVMAPARGAPKPKSAAPARGAPAPKAKPKVAMKAGRK